MAESNRPHRLHPRYGPRAEVPLWLLEALPEIESAWLRVLLYFFLEEQRTGQSGIPIPFDELARGAGVVPGVARLALSLMDANDWVERVGPTAWRLADAPPIGPMKPE